MATTAKSPNGAKNSRKKPYSSLKNHPKTNSTSLQGWTLLQGPTLQRGDNFRKLHYYYTMPTKNRIKTYGAGEYYHVYNRGVAKQAIFKEETDYFYFLSLFKRHLQIDEESIDRYGRPIKNFSEEVELNAFCLMPNHFHLLFFLKEQTTLLSEKGLTICRLFQLF